VSKNFAPVHPGEIEIQQDEIWARRSQMLPLLPQEGHGLDAIGDDM
jgi:hypothetical protein